MPTFAVARSIGAALLLVMPGLAQAACPDPSRGIGVARVVEIDATGGPVFGFITRQAREKSFLGPREVVLTFDDGPMPGITRSILDTLDQFCTKATFFSVGRMAAAYPDSVREILKRGHTLGTHTWSHPMSLPRLSQKQAKDQIESGFAAVATAAGQPIAPFFRFPGLNDSSALVKHLESRNIATFTVDVVSNDSYIADVGRLTALTLERLEAENGGIMLFHDIKHQTARALPGILAEMRRRGYKVVHLTAKHPFVPDSGYAAAVAEHVAAKKIGPQRPALVAVVDAPLAPAPAPVAVETDAEAPASPTGQSAPAAVDAPVASERLAIASPDRVLDFASAALEAKASGAPLGVAPPSAGDVAASTGPGIVGLAKPARSATAAVQAPAVAVAPHPVVRPAPVAVASPKPQPMPPPAVKPATPQIEIVAGAYPSKPPAGAPAVIPAGPAAPAIVAGSYGQPVVIPKPVSRSWQENLRDRMSDNGN